MKTLFMTSVLIFSTVSSACMMSTVNITGEVLSTAIDEEQCSVEINVLENHFRNEHSFCNLRSLTPGKSYNFKTSANNCESVSEGDSVESLVKAWGSGLVLSNPAFSKADSTDKEKVVAACIKTGSENIGNLMPFWSDIAEEDGIENYGAIGREAFLWGIVYTDATISEICDGFYDYYQKRDFDSL